MAKKQSSFFEDLFELSAMMPWWAGVGLALVSYLFLHHVAATEVTPATQIGQFGSMMVHQLYKTLAAFGQYLLPLVFLGGAAASALKRKKRETLIAGVAQSSSASALDKMTWQEFEMLVGQAFRQRGYAVTETGGGGADGGVDLALSKNNEKFLVQCKQWKAFKVGVSVVRELYGAMAAKGATGGFVVTSGQFTKEALDFAAGRNIDLIDGKALHLMIRSAQRASAPQAATTQPQATPTSQEPITAPLCPQCGGGMVPRLAKRGPNAGNTFWGCKSYPACKGVRPL